jgi:hypothetical protein
MMARNSATSTLVVASRSIWACSPVAAVAGSASGGKTRNSSLGSIRHCWSSSRLAEMLAGGNVVLLGLILGLVALGDMGL